MKFILFFKTMFMSCSDLRKENWEYKIRNASLANKNQFMEGEYDSMRAILDDVKEIRIEPHDFRFERMNDRYAARMANETFMERIREIEE